MKAGSRPQYYRIRRMVQMVREGSETGCLPNSRDFMGEVGVSRCTVALAPPRRACLSAVRQSVYGFPWAFGCSAYWTRGHRASLGNHFRKAHWEATFSGSFMREVSAWQRRWVSCSGLLAMKSLKKSTLRRNQSLSMGLKSGL